VRISLVTRRGVRSPSQLSDVAVPAAGTTTLRLNDYEVQRGSLGVEVAAVRGRVVAWQTVFAQPPDREPGVAASLGATSGAIDWYFPAGAVGGGVDQSISILNPSDDEAIVTVSLITDEEAIQPESLFEQAIPRRSSQEFDLREQLAEFNDRNLGSVSVVVRSVNQVRVVAEHAIFYGEGEFSGFTAELGAAGGAQAWWVGPALQSPARDSLLLLNTTDQEVTVDVTLLTLEGDPILGGDLSALSIPPSGRLRVPLDEVDGSGTAAALVEATGDVAVERVAYSNSARDVSTVMGTRLP
jgi:hypothetical protein